MPGTLTWLQNPAAKASSHYLITKSGQIFQLVKDEDTAWHAGVVNQANWPLYDGTNPNYYTLGIEHEALEGDALTETQYQATFWLHGVLIPKWAIPIDRDHIIGHYRLDSINRANDPGPAFPWDRLMSELIAGQDRVNIKVGTIVINGTLIDEKAYAPVRELAQALGRQVTWDANNNTVIVQPISSPAASGQVKVLISDKLLFGVDINNRVFVPVRDLAENLGYHVTWDASTNTVTIK
jgi:N-acetyl-anhydromuramyl-L-alanine amidase AmpD